MEIPLCGKLRRPPHGLHDGPCGRQPLAGHQCTGNWELQGFGTPIYVNHPYEFCSSGYPPYWDKPNPPYVPKEWNPTGTYRREFTLPGDWDDKEIFLSADGVRGAAFYYLNGKL